MKLNTLRSVESASAGNERTSGIADSLSRWVAAANGFLLSFYRACEQIGSPGMALGRERINLDRGQTLCIKKRYEVGGIQVHSGTVWVTTTPATVDIFLRTGDSIDFGKNWPVVIEALEGADITLLPK